MLTPATCRAARALAGCTQTQLADASGVSAQAIWSYETGRSNLRPPNRAEIERALADAGIDIIVEDGVPVGVRRR